MFMGRKVFFQNLHQYFLCPSHIIAGDFNFVDNKLDRPHVLNDSLPDKSVFHHLLSHCSLIDVWRIQNTLEVFRTLGRMQIIAKLLDMIVF